MKDLAVKIISRAPMTLNPEPCILNQCQRENCGNRSLIGAGKAARPFDLRSEALGSICRRFHKHLNLSTNKGYAGYPGISSIFMP